MIYYYVMAALIISSVIMFLRFSRYPVKPEITKPDTTWVDQLLNEILQEA